MKYIKLTKEHQAIVDDEDYEFLNSFKWVYCKGYAIKAQKGRRGKYLRMHRIVIKCPKDKYVDHINHNTLDNRKANLRICTRAENYHNKDRQKNNTSGYKGVSWYSKYGKWQVLIMVDKHHKHLGYYNEIEEAVTVYNMAAVKYHGEFAVLNKIPQKTLSLPS